MAKALRDEDITVFGGEQVLDFTFVADTVQAILQAYRACLDGQSNVLGQTFHFVTGRGVSVFQLARMIVEASDSSSRIRRRPSNSFDVRQFVGDPAKSRQVLGFTAAVRLEEGLKILRDRMLTASLEPASVGA